MSPKLCAALAAALAAACARPVAQGPFSERLKTAVAEVKTQPACSARVPDEWAVSWPVPASARDPRSFKVLFFDIERLGGEDLRLHEPTGEAVLDAQTGAVASCSASTATGRGLSGRRWSAAADRLDPDRFDREADKLLDRSERAAALYAAASAAGPADKALLKEYMDCFTLMAEPDLLPFYYRANPDFWEWLRKSLGRSIPAAPTA